MPTAYNGSKIVIKLNIVKGLQSAPRYVWDMAMLMGYAASSFYGACFQGLTKTDMMHFEDNGNNPLSECDRLGIPLYPIQRPI